MKELQRWRGQGLYCQKLPGSLAAVQPEAAVVRWVEECVLKEKWKALTQERQRARKERALQSLSQKRGNAASNCQGDREECLQEGEEDYHGAEAGLSGVPRGRDKHLWTQPRPFSSSGCTCARGLKRTAPAPAAKRVRDYIDATVREFAGTPETASRLGYSIGRTRGTKAGLEGGNDERDPARGER